MAWSSWKTIYKKEERSPLDRFKNRNRLLKTFGENGPRVYDCLSGSKSAESVQIETGVERNEFSLIMDFVTSNGMASVSAEEDAPSGAIGIDALPPSDDGMTPDSDAPATRQGIRPSDGGDGDDKDDYGATLSPLEKIIYDKYGDSGVKVYNLIDGEKTAEEILHETGISESKLVEILEFMNDEGIIKLEKPPESRKSQPRRAPMGVPPEEEKQPARRRAPDPDVGFKPMVEAVSAPEMQTKTIASPSKAAFSESNVGEELSPDAIPVDVPIKPRMSIAQQIKLNFAMMKYGSAGQKIYKKIDGAKDFVDLACETGQTFSNLDAMLGDLGKQGLMTFKQLTRNEILHKYGDDGYSVFKRFGRDGLLIYQLIGKVNSLKDLVAFAHIAPDRAAEIILFVHKVLGLDMPLERDMVYRYLER